MNALLATRRSILILMSLLLILSTSALAKDKQRGYLGIMFQKMTSSMSSALQLEEGEGVMINKVIDDSPADKAGLEEGDVILKFGDRKIKSYGALSKAMGKTSPGDLVELEILHNGKRETAQVELGEAEKRSFSYSVHSDSHAPDVEFFGEGGDHQVMVVERDHGNSWFSEDGGELELIMESMAFGTDRGFMGVELDDLNEQLGDYFGIDDGEGALVSKVRKDSAAAAAGLKAGDVIVSVNGESVEDAGDVHEVMSDTEPEQKIEVKIVRKGKNKTLKVTLDELPEGEFSNFLRLPHAPKMKMEFLTDGNFPHGLDHGMRKIREFHHLNEDSADLDEVREELDVLRQELEKLKKELEK